MTYTTKGRMERRMGSGEGTEKRDDSYLEARAGYLNRRYFAGSLSWKSIRYSHRQLRRHGSCTMPNKTIRISYLLKEMPRWVEDYVIVHELAHLIEPNHGKEFKALVRRYPLTEMAKGFLMAMEILGKGRSQGALADEDG
jgi:predicted metal-dependent hydrolase